MRMAAAATALGLTLLAAGTLAACSPDDPVKPPGPVPSRTPVFASEEEALAAAEDAYAAYLDVTNAVAKSGWTDHSPLSTVVRGDALKTEIETATDFAAKGYRQVGESSFDSVSLQNLSDRGPGQAIITVYLCVDVTGVDVLDSNGNSVVAPSRPNRLPLEVDIDDVEGSFKISRNEPWSGRDFC